jgi:hypothetical protein
VNNAALLRLIVLMAHGIGDFVVQSTLLASLALEDPPDQETIRARTRNARSRDCFVRGVISIFHIDRYAGPRQTIDSIWH